MAAGAGSLRLHAFDAADRETPAGEPRAPVLQAVCAVCQGIPVALTTSVEVEPDPRRSPELMVRMSAHHHVHGIRTGLEDIPGPLSTDRSTSPRQITNHRVITAPVSGVPLMEARRCHSRGCRLVL